MIGDAAVRRASEWCYKGVWATMTRGFRVPEKPPIVVGGDDAHVNAFRPSEGYLRYLKLFFWIGLVIIDIGLISSWIALLVAFPVVGIVTAPVWWFVIIVPDVIAYIAIHLRYDSTWYVLSDRSMCIRRGIWIIHETTITYENIQNVSIRQGPVQRHFGIACVFVETAGGGAAVKGSEGSGMIGHHGLLEGIDNAEKVRDLIMEKWRQSRSAGIGDERLEPSVRVENRATGLAPSWVGYQPVLEEIRDLAQRLAAQS